jgi:SdrD B-like domain
MGRGTNPNGDPRILVQGAWRNGTLLASYDTGGDLPWVFFYSYDALGLVRQGNNNLYVSDFNLGSPSRPDGIAAVVIYNDPTSPWTAIHTLSPLEVVNGGAGAVVDVPVGACAQARSARLLVVAGNGTPALSDRIWWCTGLGAPPADLVGAVSGVLDDRLGATSGNWIDVVDEPIAVPAYTSYFAYQVESPATSGDDIVHLLGVVCIDGEPTACTGSISGTLWQDDDRDGVPGAGEPPLAGVPVALQDSSGGVLATAASDAAGAFSFPLLCAGDYVVDVDESALPGGLEPTTCGSGACDPMDVTLGADDGQVTLDFGWAPPPDPPTTETRCFLGMGFWMRQFSGRGGWHGRHRLDPDTIAQIVEDVGAATGMDWTRGGGALTADDVARVLHRRWGARGDWVEKGYLVSLLNWGLNGADPAMMVDTDSDGAVDMAFDAYMQRVEALLHGRDRGGERLANRMVTSVNRMRDEGCDLLFPDGHDDTELSTLENGW